MRPSTQVRGACVWVRVTYSIALRVVATALLCHTRGPMNTPHLLCDMALSACLHSRRAQQSPYALVHHVQTETQATAVVPCWTAVAA